MKNCIEFLKSLRALLAELGETVHGAEQLALRLGGLILLIYLLYLVITSH
jgi:hypothetical protein